MKPRVMIVEDDEIIREIYALKLELEGFDVRVAQNGQEALSVAEDFEPELILLDMMMPVMGGLDFMKEYRPSARPTEVIVFSNISAPQQVQAVMQLGATDYWVKSDYTPERLAAEINRRWSDKSSSGQE